MEEDKLVLPKTDDQVIIESLCFRIRCLEKDGDEMQECINRLDSKVKRANDLADGYFKSADAWHGRYDEAITDLERRAEEVEDLKAENAKLRYELQTTREKKK